jgi:hypothetical protein
MSTSPIEIIVASAAISVMYFYRSFRSFSERRAIKDNPVSNISAAAQGFVELEGAAKSGPDGPLLSPISKTPCCAYFIRIIDGSGRNSNTYNRKSLEGFQIADKNGNCCNINPELAEFITTKMPKSVGYMSYYHQDLSALNCTARPKSALTSFFYNLIYSTRYEEYVLVEGAEVFASGCFNTKTDSNGKQSNWLDATMPTDLNTGYDSAMDAGQGAIPFAKMFQEKFESIGSSAVEGLTPNTKQVLDTYRTKIKAIQSGGFTPAEKKQKMLQLSSDMKQELPELSKLQPQLAMDVKSTLKSSKSMLRRAMFTQMKAQMSNKTNKTKKNFIISSVPRSALTKTLSLRTVFYLMIGFGSLLLCVALIIVFQGRYFEVWH